MEILSPLSFKQNSNRSIGEVTRSALIKIGVPESYCRNFDLLSPIQIVFKGGICTNISVENDRLWFWSSFSITENQILTNIESILNILTQPVSYAETDRVTIGKNTNGYELKALINPRIFSDDSLFIEAIESFYKTSSNFQTLLDYK
ncbi:hypothetical protein [Yersinia similis]|uniref:Class 1B type III secretion system chaperone spa15 n=1 Tax=Yersinia similis TaxID=367190 RepID=A0A0T9NVT2_9GAMM|nr:hypothetical protein [Yersinia similis]AHK22003.1 hypothetical protein BF17_17580 [Yersinia similis]CFQ48486.1 Class 1B type III secretion system chaperone spa15 [Yersinia similis]CNF05341.1 Class 1B type III secretion system chaperone spa15 [Yersinia similis]CNH32390.1 Class 1B type III secretion system chaperone spa15 [Yersinia similis]